MILWCLLLCLILGFGVEDHGGGVIVRFGRFFGTLEELNIISFMLMFSRLVEHLPVYLG